MNQWRNLFRTLFFLGMSTLASFLVFESTRSSANPAIFYMLAIFLISRYTTGYIWGILASITGVITVNYLFTYPFFEFDFIRVGYPITFVGMLTVSLITSMTTIRMNSQKVEALNREQILQKINGFSNHLLLAKTRKEMLQLSISFLSELNNAKVLFIPIDAYKEDFSDISFLEEKETNEFSQSTTVNNNIQQAILDNKIHSFTEEDKHFSFLPVSSAEHVWGVLVLISTLTPVANTELNQLIIPQLSLALEHYSLIEHHQKLVLESEKEKMRSNLLRAISHDLRTPLTSIIGASSTYLEAKDYLNETNKDKLIYGILEDANWLINMVENLLSVTKISQDTALVKKSLESVEEVVSEAMVRFQKRYPNSQVIVKVPKEFLMVPMDGTLIEQVIINLLENAIKHSNSKKTIELSVEKISQKSVQFSIKDFGKGIPSDLLSSIFDGIPMSEEDKNDRNKGMGIGLSICKTIIVAHQGQISASNHKEGAVFTFCLPI